jgi:hypothetical protein
MDGNLSDQFKLYHGSNQEFNVGDEIKPGGMVPQSVKSRPGSIGETSRWSDDFSELGHHDFVWSTDSPEHTGTYGKNLYQVEPQGLTARYTYPQTGKVSPHFHVSLAPMKVVRRGKLAGPHPKNPSIQKIEWDE